MSGNHRKSFDSTKCVSPKLGAPLILVLAATLAGCAVHPIQEDVTRKTTHNIVQQIRCEAKRAIVQDGRRLQAGSVAYDFEFNINEHNGATGGVSLANPFTTGGSFTLGSNVGADRIRDAVRNFKIVDSFSELRKADCSPEILEKNLVYPLSGEVGMYDAVKTFIDLQLLDNPVDKEVFTFSDTLTFTTTLSGDVTAKLTLEPVKDRLRVVEAGAGLANSRRDIHKVIVSMIGGPLQNQSSARRFARSGIRSLGIVPGNALLSTTLVQQASDYRDRALYELDRQRTLEFQRRALNIIVAP